MSFRMKDINYRRHWIMIAQVNSENKEPTWGAWFNERLNWAGEKAGDATEWTRENLRAASEKAGGIFHDSKKALGKTIDQMGDIERYTVMPIGALTSTVILKKGIEDLSAGYAAAGLSEIFIGALAACVTAWVGMDSYGKWHYKTEI